jgi:hypothetical protein
MNYDEVVDVLELEWSRDRCPTTTMMLVTVTTHAKGRRVVSLNA